jgi:exodeoxyribonuclease VII small subunit
MSKKEPTYEEKVSELETILRRLDDAETPIDTLAEDVKRGAKLIKELDHKLKSVEAEVRDAFKELEVVGESDDEEEPE